MNPPLLHEYKLSRRPQLSLSQLSKDSEDSNLPANQPEPSLDHQEKIQHETPEQSTPDCENKPCIVANETQSTPTLDILATLPTTRLSFETKATDTRYSIYHSFQEKGGEGASWGPRIEVVGSCEIILPTIDSRMLPAGTYDVLVVLVASGIDERSFLIGEVTVDAPTKAAILHRLSNRGYNVIGTGEEDEQDGTDEKDEQDAKNELWESFTNVQEHHDKRMELLPGSMASHVHPRGDVDKLIAEINTRRGEAVHAGAEDIHNQPAADTEPTKQTQLDPPPHVIRKRPSSAGLQAEGRKRVCAPAEDTADMIRRSIVCDLKFIQDLEDLKANKEREIVEKAQQQVEALLLERRDRSAQALKIVCELGRTELVLISSTIAITGDGATDRRAYLFSGIWTEKEEDGFTSNFTYYIPGMWLSKDILQLWERFLQGFTPIIQDLISQDFSRQYDY